MTLSADRLLSLALERLHTARPELRARRDLSSTEALRAFRAELTGDAPGDEAVAVVVIGTLDLFQWVRETCVFASSLTPEDAQTWRRSLTRTVYLAGAPDRLQGRFAFDHVAPDGATAWLGPAPAAASTGLRRLLKSFDGRRVVAGLPATTVVIPPGPEPGHRPPVHRAVHLATDGVTLTDALVHLNHLLAEAVMDRLIIPGDRLTVRCVPQLDDSAGTFAALRIDTATDAPDRLHAFAGLTQEIPDAVPHHR
ncbi:DUF6182 family protein [Streptomyces inhibens]|uniref:DUF6182 family protein n=1 Tax=Streptomyces inhibens TaxID=2293571 RepID=UPI001EE7527C|nr:DUF6182 family protein [Streptomyces inhibens]UKY53221.1 DUF6182 family protein [Streptomyces inhibens]